MGRAEDLYHRLTEQGEKAIDGFIVDRQSEELFLDFKRSADYGAGNKLHDDDRKNLSKAISGFGNSEGGIIVWGVDCSRQTAVGDVASFKLPLENPKRFVSWLESAVSGCTIPSHPSVKHQAIETGSSGKGFVVTHIPKSYLAPHQCLKPLQYYIRVGSNFEPAPHGVLAGLFGRPPHPFVFHMWTLSKPQIVPYGIPPSEYGIKMGIGFMLCSNGPGMARDLYVNLLLHPPGEPTKFMVSTTQDRNWSGYTGFGGMVTHLVAGDTFKLAPGARIQPLTLEFELKPPFKDELYYEFTYGHGGSPMKKLEARVTPAELDSAYANFFGSPHDNEAGKRLLHAALKIEEKEAAESESYG